MRFDRSVVAMGAFLLSAVFAGEAPASTNYPTELGNEVLVNQTTTGDQNAQKVAVDADGDYIVVWAGNGPGDSSGIFARLYNASGKPKGNEFLVNPDTTGTQSSPDVAMDAAGDFVIVWASNHSGNFNIYDRIYNADGTARIAGTASTNSYLTNDQIAPSVAMDATGNYVVVWQGEGTGDTAGIFGQRVKSDGTFPSGAVEFRVNTTTAFGQDTPAVASDANGNFVVVWVDNNQEGATDTGIYGQRYTSAGTTNGSEFHVNSVTAGDQDLPDVAMDADGDFVVVWQTDDGLNINAWYSQWNSSGVNQVGDVVVNDNHVSGDLARAPKVSMSAGGIFAIAWSEQAAGASDYDIRAELHAADRSQIGNYSYESPSQASGYNQTAPAVATDADGDFVVAWTSDQQDGNSYGVYARRYRGPEDTNLSLTLADSPDPVARSGAMTYTATITNNHGAPPSLGTPNIDAYYSAIGTASGISATVNLPSGATSISGSGTNWSCTGTTTLACDFSGKLAPGANTVLTVSLNAQAAGGTANASATVSGNQYDSAFANDTDTEATTVNPPPDVTPDQFTFTDQTGVNPSTQITSAALTITGIEQAVAISVTGGSYSVGCTATYVTSAGTIGNGQTACVRHTSSANFSTATNTTLTVGGVSDIFTSTTRAADTTPNGFNFTDQPGVEPNAVVTSDAVTIGGIEQAAPIAVSGGSYSIGCTGTFTTSAGTIGNGQTVCVQQTASANFSTPTDTTLTVGGVSDIFTSTTRAADTTPDQFTFDDVTGAVRGASYTSNQVIIVGFDGSVPVSITGGEYSIGCTGSFTSASGTMSQGPVCVRQVSSLDAGTATDATLTVGGVSDTYTVTTAAAPAAAPAAGGGGAFSAWFLMLGGLLRLARGARAGASRGIRS